MDNPIRAGYTFSGWNTAVDGSGLTWDFATTTMPDKDIALYAQWQQNKHAVTFNSNGGSGTMDTLSMSEGATQNLPSYTKEGYILFSGLVNNKRR